MSRPRIAGLVLAGGRSSRFGSPKALAVLDGETLAARMARLLGASCDVVAISVRDGPIGLGVDPGANLGIASLPDPPGAPDGPLAGVLAGLDWAMDLGADWLVTAPCDSPLLPGDFAKTLVNAAQASGADAAVFASGSGLHPLTAAWRTTVRLALKAQLAAGHPPVRAVLESLVTDYVPLAEEHLLNINTPTDLDIARRRLSGSGL